MDKAKTSKKASPIWNAYPVHRLSPPPLKSTTAPPSSIYLWTASQRQKLSQNGRNGVTLVSLNRLRDLKGQESPQPPHALTIAFSSIRRKLNHWNGLHVEIYTPSQSTGGCGLADMVSCKPPNKPNFRMTARLAGLRNCVYCNVAYRYFTKRETWRVGPAILSRIDAMHEHIACIAVVPVHTLWIICDVTVLKWEAVQEGQQPKLPTPPTLNRWANQNTGQREVSTPPPLHNKTYPYTVTHRFTEHLQRYW